MTKKFSFYSRTSILLFSFLLTGLAGVLMMGYNLWKAGKRNRLIPIMLIVIVLYTLVGARLNNLFQQRHRQWSLNRTVGWDWDISPWWVPISFQFFLANLIIGLILIFPVWKMELSQFSEHESKKAWIPLIIAFILYGSLVVALIIPGLK